MRTYLLVHAPIAAHSHLLVLPIIKTASYLQVLPIKRLQTYQYCTHVHMGVSEIRGTVFWGPCHKVPLFSETPIYVLFTCREEFQVWGFTRWGLLGHTSRGIENEGLLNSNRSAIDFKT